MSEAWGSSKASDAVPWKIPNVFAVLWQLQAAKALCRTNNASFRMDWKC